jgi:anti-sigma regulatory factor (Ser/Thr protein kinase)
MMAEVAVPLRFEEPNAHHLARATCPPVGFEHARIQLRSSLDAPGRARTVARELLTGHITAAELGDTLLALSELVTNAIRHPVAAAGDFVSVHVACAPGCIRAEVCDGGLGFDATNVPDVGPDAYGGRGLRIVDALASRWGTSVDDGHCVWFELDR